MEKTRQVLGKHDAHWSAMLGFDWMFETPSLLFNEVDDSRIIETLDSLEYLEKKDGKLMLCSFLRKNHHLLSFPRILSNKSRECFILQIDPWSKDMLEANVTIDLPDFGLLKTYCSNAWRQRSQLQLGKCSLSLTAFVYSLHPTQSAAQINPTPEKEDGSTSYSFSGATLTDIEPDVLFYHKGWIANLCLSFEDGRQFECKVWIHKKNCPIPPEEGILYAGSFWLQSSLPEIK